MEFTTATTTIQFGDSHTVEQDFENPNNIPMRNFNATELKDLFGIDYTELCNNRTITQASPMLSGSEGSGSGCRPVWDSVTQCLKDNDGFCCSISFNCGEFDPTYQYLMMNEYFDCAIQGPIPTNGDSPAAICLGDDIDNFNIGSGSEPIGSSSGFFSQIIAALLFFISLFQ